MWALIFIVSTGPSGISTGTQEFASKEYCVDAARMLVDQAKASSWYNLSTVICVPKGYKR